MYNKTDWSGTVPVLRFIVVKILSFRPIKFVSKRSVCGLHTSDRLYITFVQRGRIHVHVALKTTRTTRVEATRQTCWLPVSRGSSPFLMKRRKKSIPRICALHDVSSKIVWRSRFKNEQFHVCVLVICLFHSYFEIRVYVWCGTLVPISNDETVLEKFADKRDGVRNLSLI